MKAFEKGDFSEELLSGVYREAMKKPEGAAGAKSRRQEDVIKDRRLMLQSMYDPEVMDMVVRKLAEDPSYRKRAMGGIFDR